MLFPLSRVRALPRPVIPQSHNIVSALVGVLANRCLRQAKKKKEIKKLNAFWVRSARERCEAELKPWWAQLTFSCSVLSSGVSFKWPISESVVFVSLLLFTSLVATWCFFLCNQSATCQTERVILLHSRHQNTVIGSRSWLQFQTP